MREFVKTLAEMEVARQDIKLASLISEKKKVGVFCPVIDETNFTKCDKLCKVLRNGGINIVGIAVYEEGLDFFHSLKCDEELLNVAVMAELHRVDTMLILNLHSMWGEMMYQYFARHCIEFYFIENDDAFYYKRNYMYEHISELYDCYVDFIDEYSRKSYLGVIREGMSGQLGEYIMAPEPQYMLDEFAPRLGDVAIDAGAFDGETARDFLWCGAKVYSYEVAFRHYPLTTSILIPYQKEIFAHYGLSESIPTWCEGVLYAR